MSDTSAIDITDEIPITSCSLRDTSDGRLERIASYTLTTLRLKQDKWQKMMATDEFRVSMRYKFIALFIILYKKKKKET